MADIVDKWNGEDYWDQWLIVHFLPTDLPSLMRKKTYLSFHTFRYSGEGGGIMRVHCIPHPLSLYPGGHLPAAAANNSIRLIAIDLDGTLLGDGGRVSPRNLAALHAAQARGIQLAIATGRRHSFAMRAPFGAPQARCE